jgi:small basic protein
MVRSLRLPGRGSVLVNAAVCCTQPNNLKLGRPVDELQARTEALGGQLRAKITSKFQTSTFLAGFGFAVLAIQISGWWQADRVPFLLPTSISFMVVAIFIYIAAVIRLDALTLPKRFWREHPGLRLQGAARLAYLEDEDLWQLQLRMLFYWRWLTLAATVCMAISLSLMLLPFSPRELSGALVTERLVKETFLWTVILLICMVVYFLVLYFEVRVLRAKEIWSPLLRPED